MTDLKLKCISCIPTITVDTIYSDYLISYSDDNEFSYGVFCGYKNLQGEIVIPKGKYSHCQTDTFRHFSIVFDEKQTNSEIVAIDRKERILFDVYMFDTFPDESIEGLVRVKRNGKIGYANDYGQIVIPYHANFSVLTHLKMVGLE